MVRLDFSNVLTKFCQLSACPYERTAEIIPIVENAISMIEEIIDEEKFTDWAMPKCEYAAAAAATYRFVCRECTRERVICTRDGKASSDEDLQKRILPALELERLALVDIKGVIKDNGFLFKGFGE